MNIIKLSVIGATNWILKSKHGVTPVTNKHYWQLTYFLYVMHDREMTFFYEVLYGHTDLNVHDFVSFINNGRTVMIYGKVEQKPNL